MAIQIKRVTPTKFELISLFIMALIILVLGNTRTLLHYFGLDSSTQVIGNSTHQVVGGSLNILDGFTFTNQVVTFLIWALVGLFCFSLVESIGSTYQKVKADRSLSSFRYVHPADFNKQAFGRRVVLDFSTLVASLALLALLLYALFAAILPLGLEYGHDLLYETSIHSVATFALATAITYVWLLLLDVCLRLLGQRHNLVV